MNDTMQADPITTEIIRNAFVSCAQDMNATLIRSSYTPIIYEGKDCSVAILDEHGDVLGQSLGLPLFLGNLEICVKLAADMFGWDAFQPGDVFYMNDSYMTGTHLNDATIFGPIFWQGRRVGFSATRAHWLDVGGKDPGGPMDSTSIFQEGMRFAPTKIYDGGEPRSDIIDLLRRNGRFGYSLVGDMNAQVAACRTGETRFQAILDRFGYETYLASRSEIYRQSEELERQAVRAIPDGTYKAEGFLDDDGNGHGPLPVHVRIDVEGESMVIDLEDSAPMQLGPVNCGFAQTISACRVAFKLLINPQRPVDGGTFKTLDVKAPEGSIFVAQEPAPCQWYFSSLGLLIDLVVTALSPVLRDQVAAAHFGDSMVLLLSGSDPRRGDQPFLYVMPHAGGWGGFEGGDGEDGLINNVNGGFKDYPVEVFEVKYPAMVRAYGFRPDTGGAGQFRGGCGLYRTFEIEPATSLSLWFERSRTPGWGLFGGGDAVGPEVTVNPGSADEARMLKVNALPLAAGTIVHMETGGGGGFGDPRDRDPARVRSDVLDGFVTVEAARRDYGVVIDPDTLELVPTRLMAPLQEIRATVSLREAALRAIRAGIVTGEIRSNEIYSARALAAQLGVSPTPVREAMLDLAAQGLVAPVRNRGFRIHPMADTDLDEIHELRMLIEVPTSGRLAGKLPKAAIRRLRRFADESVVGAETGDLVGYLAADRDFHLGLLELNGNRRLVDFISRLRDQARLYGLAELAAADALVEFAMEHETILDSIEAGDSIETEARMTQHLHHVRGSWAGREETAGSG